MAKQYAEPAAYEAKLEEVCCSFGLPSVDYDFEEATSELLEWLKQPAEEDTE